MSHVADRVHRVAAPSTLVALGAVLLLVPAYDVLTDIYLQSDIPLSTFAENSLTTACAVAVVATGFWLYFGDRDRSFADTVAAWGVTTVLVAVALHVWILGIQLAVQGELKPYVVAADTVVAAGLLGVLIGVYDARTEARTDRLEDERDRFSALFENTTDCVVELAVEDGEPVVADANGRFRETFVDHGDPIGRPLAAFVEPAGPDDPPARGLADGDSSETEVRRETADGERVFLRRFVPFEDGDHGYAVYTDVTDRKRLSTAREERDRVEYLHDIASRLEATTDRERAYDLAANAAVETFDATGVALTVDGAVVASRNADAPVHPGDVDDARDRSEPVHRTIGGGGDRRSVLTVPVGDRGTLQLWGAPDAVTAGDADAAELLAAHLSETLRRLDRDERVQHERERLEFVNRILRHNLLNGMNVVDARVRILDGHVDEAYADHLDTVEARVDDMVSLIETIRTFMQAIVEDADHELEPVALDDVLEREVAKLRDAHPDATVVVDALPDVAVRADDLLGEVFENLLENAVRHNDAQHPRVTIDVAVGDDTATVTVADNGPGVPDDEKPAIFDKGVQGLSSPGTGFGLYLVKEIVDTYGGDVSVADREHGGAVFTVTLPLTDPTASPSV